MSRDWIPEADLAALEEVLQGAHREDVGGGVLLVTDRVVVDDVAEWSDDPDEWWRRVVDAAAVLARVARGSRPPP